MASSANERGKCPGALEQAGRTRAGELTSSTACGERPTGLGSGQRRVGADRAFGPGLHEAAEGVPSGQNAVSIDARNVRPSPGFVSVTLPSFHMDASQRVSNMFLT